MTTKTDREKHEDDLREIQEDNDRRRRESTRPAEIHTEVVVGVEDKDGEPAAKKVGEVHVFGGVAYVKVDAEFSKDDLLVFSQQIAKASQAVQV